MHNSIGIIELSSVANGFEVLDTMLKAANVQLLTARTICSGKYMITVAGSVSAVEAAFEAGKKVAAGFLIDTYFITNISKEIFAAINGASVIPDKYNKALGIIETFSATTIVGAADAALKAADVFIFKVHLAMALGGKGFALICGDVMSVRTAVEAGAQEIRDTGMLINKVVIPNASPELFRDFV